MNVFIHLCALYVNAYKYIHTVLYTCLSYISILLHMIYVCMLIHCIVLSLHLYILNKQLTIRPTVKVKVEFIH